MNCCFCNKVIKRDQSHEISPVRVADAKEPKCCSVCNMKIVVPTRVYMRNILNQYKEKLS